MSKSLRSSKDSSVPSGSTTELPRGRPRLFAFATQYFPPRGGSPTFAVLVFRDRDGIKRDLVVPAGYLETNRNRLIEHLANRGYRWSEAKAELDEIMRADSDKRVLLTSLPGWHGKAYVRPKQRNRDGARKAFIFGSHQDEKPIYFYENADIKLGTYTCRGSLRIWKEKIAGVAKYSSLARLFLALPFAATILYLIGGKSFGVVVVGESSIGKSILLYLSCSGAGHIDEGGDITSLKTSEVGAEELIIGHRDGFASLDDMGHLFAEPANAARFLKFLSYQATTGRRRNLASHYEAQVGAIDADIRVVYGSTSEKSLHAIAGGGNQERLLGEQVRLIEIPALIGNSFDVFDRPKANAQIGNTIEERKQFVVKLQRLCGENQGHAHRVFLKKLFADPSAKQKLEKSISIFEKAASSFTTDRVRGRAIRPFAITYAAARLAIGYKILPWRIKPTRTAILRCAKSAFDQMSALPGSRNAADNPGISQAGSLADFLKRIETLNTCSEGDTKERLAAADAIRTRAGKAQIVLLKARRFRKWFPKDSVRNPLVKALQKAGVMSSGRGAGIGTVQRQLAGLDRQSYYPIDLGKMPKLVANANP